MMKVAMKFPGFDSVIEVPVTFDLQDAIHHVALGNPVAATGPKSAIAVWVNRSLMIRCSLTRI